MEVIEVKKVWEEARTELKKTLPAHVFDTWIMPLEAVGYDNDIFALLTVHQMAVEIIRKNHYAQIKSALEHVLKKGSPYRLGWQLHKNYFVR